MAAGGQKAETKQAPNIKPYIDAFDKQTSGLRSEAFGQLLDVLRTGGMNSQLPLIGRSVENSMQAAGQARRAAEGGLSAANLAGTPFGQSQLSQLDLQSRQQASQFGPQLAQALTSMGIEVGANTIQTILTALAAEGKSKTSGLNFNTGLSINKSI